MTRENKFGKRFWTHISNSIFRHSLLYLKYSRRDRYKILLIPRAVKHLQLTIEQTSKNNNVISKSYEIINYESKMLVCD